MRRLMLILLVVAALAHAPPPAAATNMQESQPWLPSGCYDGYAFLAAGPVVRHDARLCDEANGHARLEIYLHAALVQRARFALELRVDADPGTEPGPRAETWRLDGEDAMRFVVVRSGERPATLWTPASGGGEAGGWRFVALRHYA